MTADRRPAEPTVRDAGALIEYVWETVLDDDYRTERSNSSGPAARLLTAATLLAFGLLVATAAAQTRLDLPASEAEREAVIADIERREDLVADQRKRVTELQAEVDKLHESVDGPAKDVGVEVRAAAASVTGAGITVEARSGEGSRGGITDQDVQLLVNGLWYAGAEAVAVNGQRIGSMSAIRWAGESLTVNYRPVNEPYEITAIGPPELADRLKANPSGRHWRHRSEEGVTWSVSEREKLTLASAPKARLQPIHAKVHQEGS